MMDLAKMNESLRFLCGKYGVPSGTVELRGTDAFVVTSDGKVFPLLPWRVERRFVELKNLIANGTLEDVSTFRFANVSAGGNLVKMIARELDLASWLCGRAVTSVFAVCGGSVAVNAIAKLEGGLNLSVECSTKLPAGAEPMDRHEIIARRGIASDRAVDTQVPQSSVYVYSDAAPEQRYTDTDTELFGFTDDEIWMTRAAFAVLSKPELGPEWEKAAALSVRIAEGAIASDAKKQVFSI